MTSQLHQPQRVGALPWCHPGQDYRWVPVSTFGTTRLKHFHDDGTSSLNTYTKGSEDQLWWKSGISWIHKTTSGTFSTYKTRRSHCRQRFLIPWPVTIWFPAWDSEKIKSKHEVLFEAQRDKKKVHFASLMDICHFKNSEFEPICQKYKGRVVLRGDIVKDDSGAFAVFTEQGSSASQMTAAKVMDVIARLPGCAEKQLMQYLPILRWNWRMLPDCSEFRYVFHDTNGRNSWRKIEDPVVPLERNLYSNPLTRWENPDSICGWRQHGW